MQISMLCRHPSTLRSHNVRSITRQWSCSIIQRSSLQRNFRRRLRTTCPVIPHLSQALTRYHSRLLRPMLLAHIPSSDPLSNSQGSCTTPPYSRKNSTRNQWWLRSLKHSQRRSTIHHSGHHMGALSLHHFRDLTSSWKSKRSKSSGTRGTVAMGLDVSLVSLLRTSLLTARSTAHASRRSLAKETLIWAPRLPTLLSLPRWTLFLVLSPFRIARRVSRSSDWTTSTRWLSRSTTESKFPLHYALDKTLVTWALALTSIQTMLIWKSHSTDTIWRRRRPKQTKMRADLGHHPTTISSSNFGELICFTLNKK